MANLRGKILNTYNNLTLDHAGVLTSPINKLWRAKILLNRATSPFQKDNAKVGAAYNPNQELNSNPKASRLPKVNEQLKTQRRLAMKFSGLTDLGSTKDPAEGRLATKNEADYQVSKEIRKFNEVVIYNLNTSPYRSITLQNRPLTTEFKGETSWAVIKSMGRNTPMYHYTGAEDIVQFNVSWYCDDPNNPEEVIAKCRLLESWTKSNAYQAAPPELMIRWGNSQLYQDHLYILISATYTLGNFKNYSRQRLVGQVNWRDYKLLPSTATQELIFKRISANNLSYADIVSDDLLKKTNGIKI